MSLLIIKTGLTATIQDAGRQGHLSSGVPWSGAMDSLSSGIANLLCGNRQEDPCLEVTLHGMELLVEEDALVALSGGGSTPSVDGTPVPLNRPLLLKAGTLVRFLPSDRGCRMYLALGGGIIARKDLGSCSTYEAGALGGIDGMRMRKGDRLHVGQTSSLGLRIRESLRWETGGLLTGPRASALRVDTGTGGHVALRCTTGPEWDLLDRERRNVFRHETFKVGTDSNRMGIRLKGGSVPGAGWDAEMISSGVVPGTVQMSHDGTLLLLTADAQTTGGYPRIAQVAGADMPLCAQLRPGDGVRFRETGIAEAEKALLEMRRSLRILHNGIMEVFGRMS